MRMIDADKAFEVLTEVYHHKTEAQHIALKEALNSVPTIEAEPVKTGKWINREVDHTEHMVADGTQTAKCSVCGKYHTTPYLYFFKNYAYCPNCGARMERKE